MHAALIQSRPPHLFWPTILMPLPFLVSNTQLVARDSMARGTVCCSPPGTTTVSVLTLSR